MKSMRNAIVLIGFKHVGKTVIGRELALQLNWPFIDLDEQVERLFELENPESNATTVCSLTSDNDSKTPDPPCGQLLPMPVEKRKIRKLFRRKSCRYIMQKYGESYFRDLEKRSLTTIIQRQHAVIALGGGALMDQDNQALIKKNLIIHINAPKNVVFERIMKAGRPAFVSSEESALDALNRLWHERDEVYNKLASFSIENNETVASAVQKIRACRHEIV